MLVVAAATAVFAFLLGATYVGAEWSSRSMVALLFWEPRRYRVMTVKLAVLTGVAAALGVLSQGVWLLAARVLAETRGTTSNTPTHLWTQLTAASGRGVLLAAVVALLGFAVANLIRKTAAAFWCRLRLLRDRRERHPGRAPDLAAMAAERQRRRARHPSGHKTFLNEGFVDARGFYQSTGREIVISNLHGGLLLSGVTALVVAAGVILFGRRDLN